MRQRLTLDFETRSACDLKKAGAFKYSCHPTTQPTCLAFKDKRENHTYLLKFETINKPWRKLPFKLRKKWKKFLRRDYLFSAHNAFFETCIYNNILVKRYGWPEIPYRSWRCTAAKAAACALPRALEGAGFAMNLITQKDKRGYAAMMATCKPVKLYNAWVKACAEVKAGKRVGAKKQYLATQPAPKMFLDYDENPDTWETLYRYCIIDVQAEEQLDDSLPDLMADEQEIWFLNQELNRRGFFVDIPTIQKIVDIMAIESKKKLKELDTLTMGLVTKAGARKSILEFLELEGVTLPDIRAQTVSDVLKKGEISEDAKRLLEIRQALSKTSTKKYQAFLDRAMPDGRIRDILLYHGASTGRDTGTGVQPHNFPRGVLKIDPRRPYATVDNVATLNYEDLRLLYGQSLPLVFSSILRNMILPSPGYELFVADFSKIEVAVLWWLADNTAGLKILNSGKDPYIYMAAANTGKSYEEVERAEKAGEKWAVDARQLGKAQVLGCGFGMGAVKFLKSAFDTYRLKLSLKKSVKAVKSYREQNEAVPTLWEAYEEAAVLAIETGKKYKAGKCVFFCQDDFLWVQLPSGRRLAYREPRLSWRVREYTVIVQDKKTGKYKLVEKKSEPKKTIEFLGLDKTKKALGLERTWGGTLTENIVQAVARDLMMPAMVRLKKKKYRPLLMVHDESICERKKGYGNVLEFSRIQCERPKWADKNLPLDAKGWTGQRYRK